VTVEPTNGRAVDVVVIGAGFAGLAAAAELECTGHSVQVLEARDRIGGKVAAGIDELGDPIDLGGQWLCVDMPHVLALVADAGCRLVDPTRPGTKWVWPPVAGHDNAYDRSEALYADALALARHRVGGSLEQCIQDASNSSPYEQLARSSAEGILCADPGTVAAWFAADASDRAPMSGDELQYFVAETLHEVAIKLAGSLQRPVRSSCPVERIVRENHSFRVIAGDDSIPCDSVVVAVPPQVIANITFDPPLPSQIQLAASRFVAGDVTKFVIRYGDAFWDGRGWDGACLYSNPSGFFIKDATDTAPTLVAFAGGSIAAILRGLDPEAQRSYVLALIAEVLGAGAMSPVSFRSHDWPPDEWGAGGYSAFVRPTDDSSNGDAQLFEILREGCDGIAFACSELGSRFPGYVEGALLAGSHAARQVTGRRPVRPS
jgi:monoamine oxidase